MPRAIVSTALTGDARQRAMEQGLVEVLFGYGLDVDVVADLYHSARESTWVQTLRSAEASLLVFSWLQPRAAFWTLRALGIAGQEAVGCFSSDEDGAAREILCLDMGEQCCAPKWLEMLEALVPRGVPGAGEITRQTDAVAERWYPVIDYDRCTGCMQCMEFCLFGVFDQIRERLEAAHPELCKAGCPACSRVCPSQAIIFPLHPEDRVIAGAREGVIQPFSAERIEEAREAYGRGTVGLQDVIRACACAEACAQDQGARTARQVQADAAYFGTLLDGLEASG